jgi:hypothetical protein
MTKIYHWSPIFTNLECTNFIQSIDDKAVDHLYVYLTRNERTIENLNYTQIVLKRKE